MSIYEEIIYKKVDETETVVFEEMESHTIKDNASKSDWDEFKNKLISEGYAMAFPFMAIKEIYDDSVRFRDNVDCQYEYIRDEFYYV
jgi:hypothetical protein